MKLPLIFALSLFFFAQTLSGQIINVVPILDKVGDKLGYIDKNKNIIIPYIYEAALPFSEGLACVFKNGKYNFIDYKGQTVISNLSYDLVDSYKNDLARVGVKVKDKNEYKFGFIDKKGNLFIPLVYDFAQNFNEQIAYVYKEKKPFFINTKGTVAIKLDSKFEYEGDCKEGLIPFKQNNRKGFLDKNGKVVIAAKYFNVGNFNDGVVAVYDSINWGVLNKKGEIIVPLIFDQVGTESKNIISIRNRERAGFLDKLGNVVVPMAFENAYAYGDYGTAIKYGQNYEVYKEGGIIKVKLISNPNKENPPTENNSSNVTDVKDGFFIPPHQNFTGSPEFNIVAKDGKVAFINKELKIVIPFKYRNAYPFYNGLAAVFDGKKWGFIDTESKVVIPLIYDKVLDFQADYTLAWLNGIQIVINKKGEKIE